MSEEACVRVALRVRPLLPNERANQCSVCVTTIPSKRLIAIGDKQFGFDNVFDPSAQQEDIYQECVVPLVESIFQGYNATIFAYGQTGSGKTYTMGTSTLDKKTEGVIPRVVEHVFQRVQRDKVTKDIEFDIFVSYIEIYNETLKDLLCPSTSSKALAIREDEAGGIVVSGMKIQRVYTMRELLTFIQRGTLYRATAATQMNEASSRSHSILTLHIQQTIMTGSAQAGEYKRAKFHLVDLAGSERNKRTGNVGMRFKESVGINGGLLALGNVISLLGDERRKPGTHVPYRDSKLTRLLQDSLGGNSRTLMVACVGPADSSFEETLNTLKYASRARKIRNTPVVNRGSLNALREMQMEMYFGSPPVAVEEEDGNQIKGQEDQIRQLEQDLLSTRSQLESTQRQLKEARDHLLRDEEIYEETMKDSKAMKRRNKELVQQNGLLKRQLQHCLWHIHNPGLQCSEKDCIIDAGPQTSRNTSGSMSSSPHDAVRAQAAYLVQSREDGDEVEISFINETSTIVLEDAAKSKEMEGRFQDIKAKLLQDLKTLQISNKLKEQLICELVKNESAAKEAHELHESKIHHLESLLKEMQCELQCKEKELETSGLDSASKQAEVSFAYQETESALLELDRMKQHYVTQEEILQRKVRALEASNKAQRDHVMQREKMQQEMLEKEIEQHLERQEQAEKLERELKKREQLVREKEILIKQCYDLENKKRQSLQSLPKGPPIPLQDRLTASEYIDQNQSAFTDEEAMTLQQLLEQSEIKQDVLDYVDNIIEETRKDLTQGDATSMAESIELLPGDVKNLAARKLRSTFQACVGEIATIDEAKGMILQCLDNLVECRERERKHVRNLRKVETAGEEQADIIESLAAELAQAREECKRLKEVTQREPAAITLIDEVKELRREVEYGKNTNRLLKNQLREVLQEYTNQRNDLAASRNSIHNLAREKQLLSEQMANLKQYMRNRDNIHEKKVDVSRLKPISKQALQERRQKLLNDSSLNRGNTSRHDSSSHLQSNLVDVNVTADGQHDRSTNENQKSDNESLMDLLEAFDEGRKQKESLRSPPDTTDPNLGTTYPPPSGAT